MPTEEDTSTDFHMKELADRLREITGPEGGVTPYLIGHVLYEDNFGRRYRTRFCCRAIREGGVAEDGGAPYNERT